MARINRDMKIGRVPSPWRLRGKNKRAQDHRREDPEEEKAGSKPPAVKTKTEKHPPPGPVIDRSPQASSGDDPPKHVDIRV